MPRGIPAAGFRRTQRYMERQLIATSLAYLQRSVNKGLLKETDLDRDEIDEIMDFVHIYADRFETLDDALLINLATIYQLSPDRFAETARSALFVRPEQDDEN